MSKEIAQRFEYHSAADDQDKQALHSEVRAQHAMLARWIEGSIVDSRERALALTALQESMMWANAAVAYRGML